jgi:hypothetical protein
MKLNILEEDSCVKKCKELDVSCPCETCRYWIDYEEDLNCTFVACEKNGPMTLDQVGKRLGYSLVRIRNIEMETLSKLKKRIIRRDSLDDTI